MVRPMFLMCSTFARTSRIDDRPPRVRPRRTLRRVPEPFASAEEAWFWTMSALVARREGAHSAGRGRVVRGPASRTTWCKCLDRLYRQRRIELQHARILRIWGERGTRAGPTLPARARRLAAVAGSDGAHGLSAARKGHRRRRHARHGPARGSSDHRIPGHAAMKRVAHRRVDTAGQGQRIWLAFGGEADQPWLRPLRRGFRHCFAALADGAGWTVLEPARPAVSWWRGCRCRRASTGLASTVVPGSPCWGRSSPGHRAGAGCLAWLHSPA